MKFPTVIVPQDQLALRGEVYFPNLEFEKSVVDFGCILNDTEVTRYLNITNNSPMEVRYKWSFLLDGQPIASFHPRPKPVESPQIEEVCHLCTCVQKYNVSWIVFIFFISGFS